ncbi:MAG: lysophospholipid acyltransferase family protein [Hyphomicrobiales bacterium]
MSEFLPLRPVQQGKKRRKRLGSLTNYISQIIEYIGFLLISLLLRALPLEVGVKTTSALWRVIAPKFYRHGRAINNIRRAIPALTADTAEAIIREMWSSLGATMAESFQLQRIYREKSRIEWNPTKEARDILSLRSDVIFVSGHLGNWEVPAVAASLNGHDIAGVYQKILNPYVENHVFRSRLPFYRSGLFPKGHRTVLALKNVLKAGNSVALMADLRDVRGELIDFFGIPAPSSIFPALLARHTGCPLLGVRSVRTGICRFRIDVEVIPVAFSDNRDEDIRTISTSIQKILEAWISESPEQWMWAHRRWDTLRPDLPQSNY